MNKLTLKSSITVGSLAGVLFILLFLTLFFLQTPLTSMLYNVDILLIIFFTFISMIYFRDYLNFQEMKFSEGLLNGVLTATYSSIIAAGFIYIFMTYISPDALANDIKNSITLLNKVDEKGLIIYIEKYGQKAYDQQLEAFATITVAQISILKLVTTYITGTIFTIVFSIFLRKKHVTEA